MGGMCTLHTPKEICDPRATFTRDFIHDGPLHERLFSVSRQDVSQRHGYLNATCARLFNFRGWRQDSEPPGFFSPRVGQVRSFWTRSASPRVVLLCGHALCITGTSEVDKSCGAAVSGDQGAAAYLRQKTTFITTPIVGRFSRACLITNCRQSFIYKPQGFYRKSEGLISCLPILGHHHHKRGRRELAVLFLF